MAITKYDDVEVGDGLTTIKGEYTPTAEERKSLKAMNRMFEAGKKAKEHKIGRWRRNEELYSCLLYTSDAADE